MGSLDVDAEVRRMRAMEPAERVAVLGEIIERIEQELQATEPSEEQPAAPSHTAQPEVSAED